MTTAYSPTGGGGFHVMAPTEAANGNQPSGQAQQQSRPETSLEASASVDAAGPIISTIRQSRYSETEILLLLDGASLLLFATAIYLEVSK